MREYASSFSEKRSLAAPLIRHLRMRAALAETRGESEYWQSRADKIEYTEQRDGQTGLGVLQLPKEVREYLGKLSDKQRSKELEWLWRHGARMT